MPANALFLAMDNFFCQVVNFSEQSLVRKVAVAYFAAIAERQTALPWRLRPYLVASISPDPRVGWTKIRFIRTEHLTHNPNTEGIAERHWNQLNVKQKCVLEFHNRLSDLCEHIGVRVYTRHLHRCRCLYSSVVLMAAIDTPTPYTQ